ncbi:Bet v I domain [Macleaya cordata]|uniref:Bet v I domain n=1 Tax=Macleaya cordata TaxID=56857 RepID=A0A200PU58_MACCD|nr:Bet v I domain [Macleaya cordata]
MAQISKSSLPNIAHQIQSHPVEVEVKCSADKFYGWFKNNMTDLTKLQPHIYKSVEILEGDGKSVGTVWFWKYVLPGISPDDVLVVKQTIKAIDDKKRSITFSVMEGHLLNTYKSFDVTMTVTPKEGGAEDECCLVKWCLNCGKKNDEQVPVPDAYLNMLTLMSTELGPFIHKNNIAHQIQSHPVEAEVKCSADKFYGFFKNNITDLIKLQPHIYKSVQVLEGDGKSVGTVRFWKYVVPGISPDDVLVAKERIKAMDDEKRSITFSFIEGDLLKTYKSFDITMTVIPKEGTVEDECLVKWCLDCGKENNKEVIPVPDAYLELLALMSCELGPLLILNY